MTTHPNRNETGIRDHLRCQKPSDQHKPGKLGWDCTTPYFDRLTVRLRGMPGSRTVDQKIGYGSPWKGAALTGHSWLCFPCMENFQRWKSTMLEILRALRYLKINPHFHCACMFPLTPQSFETCNLAVCQNNTLGPWIGTRYARINATQCLGCLKHPTQQQHM